ncbi:MAG TPA: ABC transporter permease [Anaerolineae bacterium]|nr:ABC transporter permease [Anaerolineae bacterium]MCB9104608.1 ABC transporter permease [Anaerolineales bacterium]HRV92867.1 ABC transporter permease [Anaerolineae bacterium]
MTVQQAQEGSLSRPAVTDTHYPPQRAGSLLLTWGKRLLWVNMVFSFVFLYAPILVLVIFSFNNSRFAAKWEGFTFQWYGQLLTNEAIISAFWNSIIVAVSATLISTVLGTMTAIAMERFRFPFRKTYDGILYLPVIVPDIVMGISLLAFFALALDWINTALALPVDSALRPGLTTVIIAHVAFNISFVAIVVRTSLRDFNKALEEAAQDLGANEWITFRRITLPLIMPGILGGALLAFTLSLDDFVITFFTTGPGGTTLPIDVFSRIRRSISPEINAISTLMLLMSIVLVMASQSLQRRRD